MGLNSLKEFLKELGLEVSFLHHDNEVNILIKGEEDDDLHTRRINFGSLADLARKVAYSDPRMIKKVSAIKLVRIVTGWNLTEAKTFVEEEVLWKPFFLEGQTGLIDSRDKWLQVLSGNNISLLRNSVMLPNGNYQTPSFIMPDNAEIKYTFTLNSWADRHGMNLEP